MQIKKKTQSVKGASLSAPLKTVMAESLYDLQGRNSFNTTTVVKGETAEYPITLGFEPQFISSRNPADATSGDFWSGGEMDGLINDWVDPIVYSSPNDPAYPYTGSYYENDPLSRVDKTSGPGEQFNAASSHTPKYCYGQYENLPNSSSNSSVQPSEITSLLNKILPNLSAEQIENLYALNVSQIALNNTSYLTNLSLTELSGKGVINLSIDPSNKYILSSAAYQIGAKVGQNGMPITVTQQNYLPNVYDNSGNILSADASKFQIQTETTSLGQVTYASSPDQGEGRAYYDTGGLLRFTQNADQAKAGVCLAYIYDGQSRLTQLYGITLASWDVSTLQSYLDKSQEPSQSKLIRQYTYDALPTSESVSTLDSTQGRLVMLESWNVSLDLTANGESEVKEIYTYDTLGRLSSTAITYGASHSYILQYRYSNLGQCVQVIYPTTLDAAKAVSGVVYTYNIQGKISQIGRINMDGSVDPSFYASYIYNSDGAVAIETLGQGQVTRIYNYNTLQQLTNIKDYNGYFTETISYSDSNGNYQDGNIQQASYSFKSGSGIQNYTYQYAYDSFGRLKSAQASTGVMPSWQLYSSNSQGNYDANGNIYGVQGVLNTYIPGTDQLQQRGDNKSIYTYTPAGRVASITLSDAAKTSFSYMIDNGRPTMVGQTQLMYNAKGERISKQTSDMTIEYYRQGAQVLQEVVAYTKSGNTYQLSYIYGPTGLIAMEVNQTVGANSGYNGTYSMLKDGLGSIRAIYNNTTRQIAAYINYSAWGGLVTANSSPGVGEASDTQVTGLFRYLYTGQEWDPEMGLYNYHARQYDPSLGRFLTPDPAHQFPSPYVYCGNNPVNDTDPTGEEMEGTSAWVKSELKKLAKGEALQSEEFKNKVRQIWGTRTKYLSLQKRLNESAIVNERNAFIKTAKDILGDKDYENMLKRENEFTKDPLGKIEADKNSYWLPLGEGSSERASMTLFNDVRVGVAGIYGGKVPFRLSESDGDGYNLILGHGQVLQYYFKNKRSSFNKLVDDIVEMFPDGDFVLGVCNGNYMATILATNIAMRISKNRSVYRVPSREDARFAGGLLTHQESKHKMLIMSEKDTAGKRNGEWLERHGSEEFPGLVKIDGLAKDM